jgi:predicted enzyme related to lactoylglutathione lyase
METVMVRGFVLLALAAVAAAPLQVPPVVMPANHELHEGKVIFDELVTPDLATSQRFYGGLFGWQFLDIPGLKYPYAEAMLDGQPVAGLVQKPTEPTANRNSVWLGFLSVADVAKAVATAQAQGATDLVPPHNVTGRGMEAVLADPEGGVFGVLASSSGNPPDEIPPVGGWIWGSLHAPDVPREARFYAAVFGYQIADATPNSTEEHVLLASENYARASVNMMPPGHPSAQAHWVHYVRVASASASVAKAVALGGRVLVAPRMDRHGGMIAVVADPLGAPVGLFEWPDAESKEVSQ